MLPYTTVSSVTVNFFMLYSFVYCAQLHSAFRLNYMLSHFLTLFFFFFYHNFQDNLPSNTKQSDNDVGATLVMSAETLSSMHIKSLSLTPKGRGGGLELQTDGDVQRNDLKHLDGRELQV
jgi:hypothetical protein